MTFDDLFANGQTDAGAGILCAVMQALEDRKDALLVLRGDADAVIPDGEHPFGPLPVYGHLDLGRLGAAKLDGIGDKILEDLQELYFIPEHHRQGVLVYYRAGLFHGFRQVVKGLFEDRIAVSRHKRFAPVPTRE